MLFVYVFCFCCIFAPSIFCSCVFESAVWHEREMELSSPSSIIAATSVSFMLLVVLLLLFFGSCFACFFLLPLRSWSHSGSLYFALDVWQFSCPVFIAFVVCVGGLHWLMSQSSLILFFHLEHENVAVLAVFQLSFCHDCFFLSVVTDLNVFCFHVGFHS